MSYATPTNMLSRYDARTLGDLATDTGTRVDPINLLSNTALQDALDDSTGQINASCQIADRYTEAELAGLTGSDKAILLRLNCDLAFVYLCNRRGVKPAQYEDAYNRSTDMLEKLRLGKTIFNSPGDVQRGIPSCESPSFSTVQTVNALTAQASPLWPTRRTMIPTSGGWSS